MFTLPKLPYSYDALEPYIDSMTMEIHYTKHHQTYVDKLNQALEKYQSLQKEPIEKLLSNLGTLDVDEKTKTAIRNHGGGHANHSFFWNTLGPSKKIDTELSQKITKQYGSIDGFKEAFSDLALAHFGSGWMWLVETPSHEIKHYSTINQDSPYLSGDTPLVGLDLWEHAYYLKYQNRRVDYIKNWWNIIKVI